MHGLDVILSSAGRLRVLRTLHHASQPLAGRAVQRSCGLSNRATMMALQALADLGAVHCEITKHCRYYRLNRESYLVRRAVQPALEAEENFWDDVRKTIRRSVHPRPIAAIATGPLARDETDYGGRLILTMVFAGGRDRIRALKCMERLGAITRERYSMALEHHLLDINTMDDEEYVPLWRRVEREGILLFGTLP